MMIGWFATLLLVSMFYRFLVVKIGDRNEGGEEGDGNLSLSDTHYDYQKNIS